MTHYIKGEFNINQLKEVIKIMENQETSDRDISKKYELIGEYGDYIVDCDIEGSCIIESINN